MKVDSKSVRTDLSTKAIFQRKGSLHRVWMTACCNAWGQGDVNKEALSLYIERGETKLIPDE